ncbi:MAG: dTMP kinase [Gemmatimonadota bacterium]|jgi:dTMP kinase
MGLFIVLEGVEGSGKTTQARLLGERLARAGIDHLVTREPGGTEVGEEIRRILLHGGEMPARAELLLLLAARAVFVEEVVRPALERGAVVVADRYELSTLAYQGYGRGLPLDEVRRMNAFATGGLSPDLTLVLDVPPEIGAERRAREGRNADRIEQAGAEFHAQVARAYRLLAETEPRVMRIDGARSPEAVHAEIVDLLRSRFPETLPFGGG